MKLASQCCLALLMILTGGLVGQVQAQEGSVPPPPPPPAQIQDALPKSRSMPPLPPPPADIAHSGDDAAKEECAARDGNGDCRKCVEHADYRGVAAEKSLVAVNDELANYACLGMPRRESASIAYFLELKAMNVAATHGILKVETRNAAGAIRLHDVNLGPVTILRVTEPVTPYESSGGAVIASAVAWRCNATPGKAEGATNAADRDCSTAQWQVLRFKIEVCTSDQRCSQDWP